MPSNRTNNTATLINSKKALSIPGSAFEPTGRRKTDKAYLGLISIRDSVWLAAADLCRALAAKYAVKGFSFEIPGAIKLDKKEVPKFFIGLASKYEARANSSADGIAEFIDSFDFDINDFGEDISEYVGDY